MTQSDNSSPRKSEKHAKAVLSCKGDEVSNNSSTESDVESTSIVKKLPPRKPTRRTNLDRLCRNYGKNWNGPTKQSSEKTLEIANCKRFTVNRKVNLDVKRISPQMVTKRELIVDKENDNNNHRPIRTFESEIRELAEKVEREVTREKLREKTNNKPTIRERPSNVRTEQKLESEIKELLSYADESKIPTEAAKSDTKKKGSNAFEKYHSRRFGNVEETRTFVDKRKTNSEFAQHRSRSLSARNRKNMSLWRNVILRQHFHACQQFGRSRMLNKTV